MLFFLITTLYSIVHGYQARSSPKEALVYPVVVVGNVACRLSQAMTCHHQHRPYVG
jgi:hypothetical protein